MVSPETIRKVRLDKKKGVSDRKIARKRGVDRKTVKTILDSDRVETTYSSRKRQEYPKLDPFREPLEQMLAEREELSKKQRCKLTRLFERLAALGYDGGYDSVRRYCTAWLRRREPVSAGLGCIPMVFQPGEAFQFDWTPEYAIINGVTTPVHIAVMTLCHSRMPFIRAYPRETSEMVLDAHVRAFSFFGGSCERGIYDNMKTAVIKVHRGKKREWQKRFSIMSSHYLFEHNACTPGEPQEKGTVERKALTIQEDFFRPTPKVASFDELNEQLESEVIRRARERMHPEFKGRSVMDVFLEEQQSLTLVGRNFGAYVTIPATVSPTQLIQLDKNSYSTPLTGKRVVDLRVYADRLEVIWQGEVVAEHQRVFGRDKVITEFQHYLKALKRKPGAIRNGIPFQDENLPTALVDLRWRMKDKYDDAERQFVDILCAVRDYGVDDVCCACELALEKSLVSKEVVLNILYRIRECTQNVEIEEPDNLVLSMPPSDDCSLYDGLLQGEYNDYTATGI